MSTEIVHQPDPVMSMIQSAIDKGMDVASLQGLFEMQRQYAKDRAAEKFAESLRRFQSLMPAIEKKNPVYGKNKELGPQYHFAPLEDIMEVAQPILDQCEITPTFDTSFEGSLMRTTCHVRVGTHVEDTSVTLGIPTIPNANNAQMAGACVKYGMRYALIAALNIRVKGEDTDGVGLGVDDAKITEAELKLLRASISETSFLTGVAVDIAATLRFAGPDVKKFEDMNREQFARVMNDLGFRRQKAMEAERGKK